MSTYALWKNFPNSLEHGSPLSWLLMGYSHTLKDLRDQWLIMYRALIASPHNPRNDIGARSSPYPKQAPQVEHNPHSENKQYPNKQYNHPYSTTRDINSSQPNTNRNLIPNLITRTAPEI